MGVIMKNVVTMATLCLALALPSAGWSEVLKLKPASPQPSAGSLKSGLAVKYAFRNRGRSQTNT